MKKKQKNKKGFSIMEVIFAAFILAVGITAVLGLMAKSLKDSLDSRNEIIASELAQEGVELVRNIRDNNWANNSSSFSNSSGFPNGSSGQDCIVDPSAASFSSIITFCSNGSLSWRPSLMAYSGGSFISGAYVPGTNVSANTLFSRKVNISYVGSGTSQIAVVKSYVVWNGTGSFPSEANCNIANKCVEVEDDLTQWSDPTD